MPPNQCRWSSQPINPESMNKTFQDLLTAARTVKNPPAALSAAIEAAEKHFDDPRREQIVEMAQETLGREGAIEFDDDAVVSEGSDNGAYVEGWIWVDFAGTPLDKAKDEQRNEEDSPANG